MTGVEKRGRSSNHFTKRVCFLVRKRVNQCTKEERLSRGRFIFSSKRPKMTGAEKRGRSSEVQGSQTVLVSFERECGRLSDVFKRAGAPMCARNRPRWETTWVLSNRAHERRSK